MEQVLLHIKELEQSFQMNEYNGQMDKEETFRIFPGVGNVMISVPHATNHKRNDMVKVAEFLTGGLGKYLHEATGCHLIVTTKISDEDPNYDLSSTYKNELVHYIRENQINLLLDIHGASSKWGFDIEIGTAKGKTIRPVILNELINQFYKQEIHKVEVDSVFSAGFPGTITSFTYEHCAIDCCQIEIHRAFRDLEYPEKLLKLIKALTEIIQLEIAAYDRDKI